VFGYPQPAVVVVLALVVVVVAAVVVVEAAVVVVVGTVVVVVAAVVEVVLVDVVVVDVVVVLVVDVVLVEVVLVVVVQDGFDDSQFTTTYAGLPLHVPVSGVPGVHPDEHAMLLDGTQYPLGHPY
jgi:hypothetical protein